MSQAETPSPKLRVHRAAPGKSRKASRLGWTGGLLARLVGRGRRRITAKDLRRHDYATSTQRLGVRFTERIRDVFRFRWLRKTR